MKTMNDFNSDDDDNDDFLVDCKIYLLGKKIYRSTEWWGQRDACTQPS